MGLAARDDKSPSKRERCGGAQLFYFDVRPLKD